MIVPSDAIKVIGAFGGLIQYIVGSNDPNMDDEYIGTSLINSLADATTAPAVIGTRWVDINCRTKLGPIFAEKKKALALDRKWAMGKFGKEELRTLRIATAGKYDVDAAKAKLRKGQGGIILSTIAVVDYLELTMGFGPPADGDDFKTGSYHYGGVSKRLLSAFPGDSWQGDAARAYARQTETQQCLAQTMAGLDLRLAAVADDQAGWNAHMRLGLGIDKGLLLVALLVEEAMLRAWGMHGIAAAKTWAVFVAGLGVGAAGAMVGTLAGLTGRNAREANELAAQYDTTGAKVVATGTSADVKATAALSLRTPGSDIPDVLATPAAAGFAGAAIDAGEGRGAGAPAELEAPPTRATAFSPAVQLSALAGRSAQRSERAAKPSKAREVAPAEQTSHSVETACAGGGETAERAPAEVAAVGGEQAQRAGHPAQIV